MTKVQFSSASLAQQVQGRLVGADVAFDSVSIDTRTLTTSALFVALKGPNFDGHDYVSVAMARGAVAALVERELPLALPQIVVPDALTALSQFAHVWRMQFGYPVIGVTGSNGKTTTKEMLGSILSQRGACLVTRGNLNNHIGVPLTLLGLNAGHQAAVIEMGASNPGEIAHLARIARPDIGLVTNAGAAHLEGFGGLEGVARGKGELFQALSGKGVAIINADDVFADYWRVHCNAATIYSFGVDRAADFSASKVLAHHDAPGGNGGFQTRFELSTPQGVCAVSLQLAGIHNLRNALGAAAAAHAAGASLAQIQAGLNSMRPVGGRLQPKPAIHDAALIDDSYNANPNSVKAGIDALRSLGGRRWLIFGDMLELGPDAPQMHVEVGVYARSAGIEKLLAVGANARHAVDAFGAGGQWFASLDELIAAAQATIEPGVTVLIKGSRGNRLERAAAALSAGAAGASDAAANDGH
ncbi:MAG: UDP-N-acetylmuramoyl-tripeptide--D-alanyl-D-alanine ligase [Steroidobacteraceae bacterium]